MALVFLCRISQVCLLSQIILYKSTISDPYFVDFSIQNGKYQF
jgi:hypothetical protein